MLQNADPLLRFNTDRVSAIGRQNCRFIRSKIFFPKWLQIHRADHQGRYLRSQLESGLIRHTHTTLLVSAHHLDEEADFQ